MHPNAGHRLDEGISIASGARQASPQAALHDPHGDDDNVCKLTEAEAAQVKAFHQACSAKFAEIKACIAGELGYDPAALSVAEETTVDEAATKACELWEGEAEMAVAPAEPVTPLQRLSRKHWELGERILDIQDEDVERAIRGTPP